MKINNENQNNQEHPGLCLKCKKNISNPSFLYLIFLFLVSLCALYMLTYNLEIIEKGLIDFSFWFENHIIPGSFTFFTFTLLCNFLGLPQLNLGILYGFFFTKTLGFPIGFPIGVLLCFLSYTIAGIFTFYFIRFLFYNCFRFF